MSIGLPNDHLQVLMYKLSLAGSQIPVGPAYDPDAEAYFAAYGISDAQKQPISDWYAGLKSLGAYDSLVAGYMLRSSQNIGSGVIAGEMKMNYPGTLVNLPVWGVDGITFSSTNQSFITASVPSGSGNRSLFSVNGSMTLDGPLIGHSEFETTGTWFTLQFRNNPPGPSYPYFAGFAADVGGGLAASMGNNTYAATRLGTLTSIFRNGSISNSGNPSLSPTGTQFYIGTNSSAAWTSGTIAFAAYWESAINVSLVDSLYRSTIGQGLF